MNKIFKFIFTLSCIYSFGVEAINQEALPSLLQTEKELLSRGVSIPELISNGRMSSSAEQMFPPNAATDGFSSFYYHSHRKGEMGHIHTYINERAFSGTQPFVCDYYDSEPPIVALSFDKEGKLKGFFTTNLHVTGGCLYNAEATIQAAKQFRANAKNVDPLVNRWLTAVFTTFADEIAEVLKERDQAIAKEKQQYGERIFKERNIEILSKKSVKIPNV